MAKKNTTKFDSNKQEQKVAKQLGGKVTVASGALPFQKADVRSDLFLIECKTTKNTYYSLTENTWNKIKRQANKDGMRLPLMCIDVRSTENKDATVSLVVMRYLDFVGLEFDSKAQYLGNPVPEFIEASSVRINDKFIHSPFPQTIEKDSYPCYRRDIKFLDIQEHLVVIPWEDFLYLVDTLN